MDGPRVKSSVYMNTPRRGKYRFQAHFRIGKCLLRTMRTPFVLLAALAALLASCGSEPSPSPSVSVKKAEAPKPADESRRFPKANLVETKVVDKELLGKPFMPGGTLARYKKGNTEYE